MAATGIAEVRPTHEAILDKVLANPHGTLRELSAVTGYSVSWLSQIMRSDCFRAAYDERREGVEALVMRGVGEKLNDLAHLALDKLEETLTKTEDPDFKLDAFDKIMHRAGYAPRAAPAVGTAPAVVVHNSITLSRDELAHLRGQVIEGSFGPPPGTSEVLPPPGSIEALEPPS